MGQKRAVRRVGKALLSPRTYRQNRRTRTTSTMAAIKSKIPVGSAPWLVQERRHADELVDMETEEFGYAVRNEMEWLNEHMGEIFSKNNLYVAR